MFLSSDFKNAFDRVWHAATLRKHNISANLTRAIEHPYDKALSAIQMNGNTGEWFEQQLELGKDVFSHPPYSTFFSKGLRLMLWKNITVRLAQAAEL